MKNLLAPASQFGFCRFYYVRFANSAKRSSSRLGGFAARGRSPRPDLFIFAGFSNYKQNIICRIIYNNILHNNKKYFGFVLLSFENPAYFIFVGFSNYKQNIICRIIYNTICNVTKIYFEFYLLTLILPKSSSCNFKVTLQK